MDRQRKRRGKHRAPGRSNGCRDGQHDFGSTTSVGGGLVRSVCTVCGDVSIDLRVADEPTTPGLFIDGREPKFLERAQAHAAR